MSGLLSVTDAAAAVLAASRDTGIETVPLEAAAGRILRETVTADRDYPPINRVTMDGIAISHASWDRGIRTWKIEQTIGAGTPPGLLRDPASGCVRIMTGAELPANADGVIPVEDLDVDADTAAALPSADFSTGQFIHPRGSDRRKGDRLLSPGMILTPPRLAVLASAGRAGIAVGRLPRVAAVSTGSEIVPVDRAEVEPTEVRASNLTALIAALHGLGIGGVTAEHIADDPERTTARIAELIEGHDILVISGGVSKGAFDYVPAALARCGVNMIFHRVAQRPGKPLWFGRSGTCTVFGLPGNPVSTQTVFYRYVIPYILQSAGACLAPPRRIPAPAASPHESLTLFLPVTLNEADGTAVPVDCNGSGDLAAAGKSDGFIEVPPGAARAAYNFHPW